MHSGSPQFDGDDANRTLAGGTGPELHTRVRVGPEPNSRTLSLSVTDQSPTFAIDQVIWTVWRQDAAGLTRIATQPGQSVTVPLTAAGQYQLHADVWTYRFGAVARELALFVSNGSTAEAVPSFTFVAGDGPNSRSFRLVEEVQDFTYVNPKVVF